MRKIIVLSFLSLDGVMQAPGGPDEDTSNDFKFGGWTAPFFHDDDNVAVKMMEKQMKPSDLLLGRKTFDIFSSYWPKHADYWPGINDVTKFVVSNTMNESDWENSVFLKSIDDIKKLKNSEGSDLQVHGSSVLVQSLLHHNLVDELWLKIFPVILGKGKRLFSEEALPAAFTLTENIVTPTGVIFANYQRAGEVKTGIIEP